MKSTAEHERVGAFDLVRRGTFEPQPGNQRSQVGVAPTDLAYGASDRPVRGFDRTKSTSNHSRSLDDLDLMAGSVQA
jgi:hypothetical protein